jgi:hypothetical protein
MRSVASRSWGPSRVSVPLSFPDGYQVTAEVITFHGLADGAEHVALVLGDPATAATSLVRLHSECLTADGGCGGAGGHGLSLDVTWFKFERSTHDRMEF